MQNQPLNPRRGLSMSHNVYCGYKDLDHNILCQRRIMCSPYIGTENHTFSNPHQITWSQLRARENQQETLENALIGGLALAMLLVAMAFV